MKNEQRGDTGDDTIDAEDDPLHESASSDQRFLRIDEVARRTQLTKRTLRYYEELQLLDPAQRSEGNYRLYSEADVRTLEHIKQMRDLLGLELKEIREMVAAELERDRIRERWRIDEDPAWRLNALDEVEAVARRELNLLEEKMSGLERMQQELVERLQRYARLRQELRSQLPTGHLSAPTGAAQEKEKQGSAG